MPTADGGKGPLSHELLLEQVKQYLIKNALREEFLALEELAPEPKASQGQLQELDLGYEELSEQAPQWVGAAEPKEALATDLRNIVDRARRHKTFSEELMHYLSQKQLSSVEVYKKIGMDRKLFSKILSNKVYHPERTTAIALGVALQLNLEQLKDFIGRAGYMLNPAADFDMVIEYLIGRDIYDVEEIDRLLVELQLPTLCHYN